MAINVRFFGFNLAWAFVIAIVVSVASNAAAQEKKQGGRAGGAFTYPPKIDGAKAEVYKTIGDVQMSVYIFNPAGHQPSDKRPAIVFFFGGGWTNGSPVQFEQHCRYLASRGMVAMTADYRVGSRHKVQGVDCVRDAKSAVRWIRANAEKLGIDPQRIAAGGGSAGGHIAACAGVLETYDEPSEDARVSSRPNALVLFNPVMAMGALPDSQAEDDSPAKTFYNRMGVKPEELSPAHHVRANLPPTIQFFGTDDKLIDGAKSFEKRMQAAGNRCETVSYDGQRHGFFNFGRADQKYFRETVTATDRFLTSLNYLEGNPTIDKYLADLAAAK